MKFKDVINEGKNWKKDLRDYVERANGSKVSDVSFDVIFNAIKPYENNWQGKVETILMVKTPKPGKGKIKFKREDVFVD